MRLGWREECSPPTYFPLSPLLSKEAALERRESKVDCETPKQRKNKQTTKKLSCVVLQAGLQNGLLKQETVRMKESKRLHCFYMPYPVSVSDPVQCFFFSFVLSQTRHLPLSPSVPPSLLYLCVFFYHSQGGSEVSDTVWSQ